MKSLLIKVMTSVHTGYASILLWHVWMNHVHHLAWGGDSWVYTQYMGIPFLVDHWVKFTVLVLAYKGLKYLFKKVA